MTECTEKLTQDIVRATWEGSHAAQKKDVAWIAALSMSSQVGEQAPDCSLLPKISHNELIKSQRKDSVMSKVKKLKEDNMIPDDKTRKEVTGATRKLLYERNRLHLEDGLLYS